MALVGALLLAVVILAGVGYLPTGNAGSVTPFSERVASGPGAKGPLEAMDFKLPDTTGSVQEKAAEKPPAGGGEAEKTTGKPLDVLVLGVDKRPAGSEVKGSRADTIMVARIFPDTGDVKMLSIPRDLFVEIKPGVEDRINAAYAYGGVQQTIATVERLTGITVDRYAVVDFQGFKDIVNAVDGVTVDVKGALPRGWDMEGRQTLDGRRALLYARYRGTPGGDLDRIARQQQVVNALYDKVLGWNSLLKLPEMVQVARDNVETDSGFVESLSLGRAVLRDGGGRVDALQLKGTPTTMPDGRQVLIPDRKENERLVRDFEQPDAS